MNYPKAQFKKGDRVSIDNEMDVGRIKQAKLFKKDNEMFWSYQIIENMLPGFWARENRLKLI